MLQVVDNAINTTLGHYSHIRIFWRDYFGARKKRLTARGSGFGLASSQNSLPPFYPVIAGEGADRDNSE